MDVAATGRAGRPTLAGATPVADRAMVKAAQDFEALFINQLLKTMRSASGALGKGVLSGNATRMYQDMLDEQLAGAISRSGGLGLADLTMRDMVRRQGAEKKSSSSQPPPPIQGTEATGTQGGVR